MTKLLSAFGKVASFTARGAAVTFGSTVFSCAAACSIEKGANRMIYKYYPHKFANVEAASGITQEELDFVHFMYGGRIAAAAADAEKSSLATKRTETTNAEVLYRYDSFEETSTSQYSESNHENPLTIHMTETKKQPKEEEKSAVDKFWTEGEDVRFEHKVEGTYLRYVIYCRHQQRQPFSLHRYLRSRLSK